MSTVASPGLNEGALVQAQSSAEGGIGQGTVDGLIVLSSGAGLLLVSSADALSRSGHGHGSVLFWLGLLLIFLPVGARLCLTTPTRNERAGLLVVLGIASYLVKVFRDPFRFLYADELVHQYNVISILGSHTLFRGNPILPATAAYPGLEAPTAALSALTGLSRFASGLVVIGVARVIMMLGLFLLYETVFRSGRIAGLGSALYAASPHYLFFTAQFSYESLALPLAILALAAALRRRSAADAGRSWLAVALLLTAGVVVTHHMTSYALTGVLILLCLVPIPQRYVPRPWLAAVAAVALTVAWLVLVARKTVGYLSPVILGALRETLKTAEGEARTRQLFHSGSGGLQGPTWEHYVALLSVLVVAAAVPFGVRTIWRRYRDEPAALVLGLAALAYVVSFALRLVPAAWETTVRSSEFLFVGGAATLALVGIAAFERFPHRIARAGLLVAAAILLLGAVISTSASNLRLAQPYRVSADGTVLEPPATTAAQWARLVLGPGNRIATEAADGRLFLIDGRQHVFLGQNPPIAILLATKTLFRWQIALLRRHRIRYVAVDRKPSGSDLTGGYYFSGRNQSDRHLPVPGKKFERAGASLIYEDGNIAVYDLEGSVIKRPSGLGAGALISNRSRRTTLRPPARRSLEFAPRPQA